MDENDGRFAEILADRLAKRQGHTLGIVTVSGEALQMLWDIQRASIAEALTSEPVIRRGTYVLADYIAGAPIEEHLTRVVNSMLREAGITKGEGDGRMG